MDREIYSTIGSYQFKWSAEHDVTPEYLLRITMPSGVTVQQKTGCSVIGFIYTGYKCNSDGANNQIVITNLVASTVTAGTVFIFTVDSITNPSEFIDLGLVKMELLTNSGGRVDVGDFTFAKNLFQPSSISSFSISPLDTTAGNYPVSYVFFIKTKARVAKGASLNI